MAAPLNPGPQSRPEPRFPAPGAPLAPGAVPPPPGLLAGGSGEIPGLFGGQAAEPDAPARVARLPRRSTLLGVVSLVPLALAASMIVVPVAEWAQHFWRFGAAALLVVWWLPAPLFFARPAQRLVAARLLGCREPVAHEAARLAGPWASVLRRAGIPEGRYRVVVCDVDDVNAMATGGYVVAVTSLALQRLQPRELEAVLAHELGHHLNLHMVPRFLRVQLMIPVRAVRLVYRLVWGIFRATTRVAAVVGHWMSIIVMLAAFLVALWVFGLWAVPALFALIGLGLGRIVSDHDEYEADRTAVNLGLGPQLLSVLETFLQRPRPAQPRTEQIFGMRPLIVRRTERLRAAVARTGV